MCFGVIGSAFALPSLQVFFGCCRHLWVTSTQRLMVHFNPSALLSVGDALAFVTTLLSDQVVAQTKAGPQPVSVPHFDHVSPTVRCAPHQCALTEQQFLDCDEVVHCL